jgi:hypothetical protein
MVEADHNSKDKEKTIKKSISCGKHRIPVDPSGQADTPTPEGQEDTRMQAVVVDHWLKGPEELQVTHHCVL